MVEPDHQTDQRSRGVAIRALGLAKAFGATAAVHGVDLEVRPGELLALLGPSGSGKTTLLRLVAGLEVPTGGRLLFDGVDATDLSVQARRVGFVFQSYALFRHMTVAENIAYGLAVRPRRERPSRAEIARRVEALLALVQLEGLGGRHPHQLSGGQQQRVALARALAVEPSVLLLDEPFGALDAAVRHDLRRWLRQLHDRAGRTTLFVTHDQDEALELADRVAILSAGRVEQVGTPDDVLDRPSTAFVAGFVGAGVPLAVVVEQGWLRLGASRAPLPPGLAGTPDGPATAFARPRDFVLVGASAPGLDATVTSVRRAGAYRRAEIAFGPGLPTAEIETDADVVLSPGARVRVALAAVRLFR